MYKTHYIFCLLFLLFSCHIHSQVKVEGEILSQTDSLTHFSFDIQDTDYQSLSLSLELIFQDQTEIVDGSFLSLQMTQSSGMNKPDLEFARIYLPSNKVPYRDIIYDFDLILWQSLLKKNGEIKIQSSAPHNHLLIKASLLLELGSPPFIVKDIIPLWQSSLKGFEYGKDGISEELLGVQKITLPEACDHAFIDLIISGESEVDEAEARFYFLKVNGEEIAKRSVWREDCSSNPLFPQMDNWYVERPNWCPGLRVHPYSHFLKEKFLQDSYLEIELLFQKDQQEASRMDSYVISAVVFALEQAPEKLNADITEILAPNNKLWHHRYNPICGSPVLFIQNTGSETIKSITFNYGYNYETDTKFRWKGELEFMEEELIYLPPLNWYFYENNDQPETFTAHISAINGEKDTYVHASKTSEMVLANVYPSELRIEIQTDINAHDNGLEIFNDEGDVYFYTEELKADSLYKFNIDFKAGCYEMIFYDNEGNGLDLEDAPFLKIFDANNNLEIRNFHPDFGAEIREQFMIFKK